MIVVRKVDPEKIYEFRHQVLRPHQTLEDCKYDTDHQEGTFHVGAFLQGELLISIASFNLETNPDFKVEKQYRLRAMATLEEYRKLGAGRKIVTFAENLIKEKGVHFLWCKGRTSVQEYYSRLGFSPHGEVFEYPPIGPHIIMFKELI